MIGLGVSNLNNRENFKRQPSVFGSFRYGPSKLLQARNQHSFGFKRPSFLVRAIAPRTHKYVVGHYLSKPLVALRYATGRANRNAVVCIAHREILSMIRGCEDRGTLSRIPRCTPPGTLEFGLVSKTSAPPSAQDTLKISFSNREAS